MSVQSTNRTDDGEVGWRAVAAVLAAGTFAVGTDAFVVSGLLPDIAADLQVDIGAAGQLVTVFAVAYAVAAIPLASVASRWSPRVTVLAALAVFVVGNVLTAVAPTYELVLVSRVVAAAGAALYTATASATAGAAAGVRRRGRAIAVVMFGLTAALVLGAPAGTVVGNALGWRTTLWVVAALGVLAAGAIAVRLAGGATAERVGFDALRGLFRDRRVAVLLARTFVAFLGIYLPYTYISVVYEPLRATGIGVAVMLLVFGIAGSAGNLLAGRLSDRFGPRPVLAAALIALTVAFAVVVVARYNVISGLIALAVTGFLSFAVTTPQQHSLLALAPDSSRQATAAYQAVLYAAVSASGAIGALLIAHGGGVTAVVVAAALVLLTGISQWRTEY